MNTAFSDSTLFWGRTGNFVAPVANGPRHLFFMRSTGLSSDWGGFFAELQPYALYPPSEYFGGLIRKEPVRSSLAVPLAPRSGARVELQLSA